MIGFAPQSFAALFGSLLLVSFGSAAVRAADKCECLDLTVHRAAVNDLVAFIDGYDLRR